MKKIILQFLKKHSILYKMSGKNVIRGNVGIKCPLCHNDKSFHCNISLQTGYFFCWRNSSHRGTLQYLSLILTGSGISVPVEINDNEFRELFNNRIEVKDNKLLSFNFPSLCEFKKHNVFTEYLVGRGFDDPKEVAMKYDIRYSLYNKWGWRLIFPISIYGRVVSYLGRSIQKYNYLPYMELSKEESIIPPKSCIYNFDNIFFNDSKHLIVTEGVFDAIKIDYYSPTNISATCLFTKRLKSDDQLVLLSEVVDKFDDISILLDADAMFESMELAEVLRLLGKKINTLRLPTRFKDPGEMTEKDVKDFCKEIF